ncbi:hypothetical protein [Clostridium magnum]|uniref:Uncharacterized protein n=1 Tax=Clostridium magnum DSM 2767 TaxID=1121326 RepID=A0A161WYF9_9CLOT|nr:hypothetical protein [Clostridium magnum]KZL92118.1 hypothetical protein CLMAG_19240 [Clostridium magnum DSM 2767]SHH21673.1 hypothetical protein SAMN02745944_00304 [Clostridium magnum DSM 2767]
MHTEIFAITIVLGVILFLALIGLLIYSLIEFIQLSHLAIRALTIYINNNENKVR